MVPNNSCRHPPPSRTRLKIPTWCRNLRLRPPKPALGNGRLQRQVRRAFLVHGGHFRPAKSLNGLTRNKLDAHAYPTELAGNRRQAGWNNNVGGAGKHELSDCAPVS
jgi:hypothetical protein